ncbi:hypothetical protein [Neisseria musculi]|uniref:hypothetical protein n=1 Tax=Neisseria musculi TaxID=1815583 RepID=UPI00164A452B|nr:hypothetical protein [Neisseria musculi]
MMPSEKPNAVIAACAERTALNVGKGRVVYTFYAKQLLFFYWNDGFVIFEHSQERCGFAVPSGIFARPKTGFHTTDSITTAGFAAPGAV